MSNDHRSPYGQRADEQLKADILEAYVETKDVPTVALRLGISERTVMRHTQDVRPKHPRQKRYSQEEWDAIEKWLTEEGGSYLEAHRTFGPDPKAIARRFPTLGWRRSQAAQFSADLRRLNRALEKVTYANS
jgi:hypothetical protein